jgi:microcystin-dependent protein
VCDGSAVSRSTYSGLFGVLGTAYGAGDGSTTFNLPNLKGRVIVGRDSADADWDTLGETRGAKTHTLSQAEMPVHTHGQSPHNHSQYAHNHSQSAHNHLIYLLATSSDGSHRHEFTDAGTTNVTRTSGSVNTASTAQVTDYTEYAGTHSHTVTGFTVDATATNIEATATNIEATPPALGNAGSGSAHNNIQPSIVLNFIIRF